MISKGGGSFDTRSGVGTSRRSRFDRSPGVLESVALQRVREVALWPRERILIRRYRAAGGTGPPPPSLKRSRLADLARDHGITTVVETGTYLGDSTAFLVHRGFRVVTIELDSHLAERARRRFADAAAVTVLEGDSGCVLQDLVPTLTEPALFWLDGHFSGGVTARGDSDTPILRELEAIASSPLGSQHVIVIDDARCFDGRTYPTLDELRDRLSSMGRTMGGVVDDAIAIIPAK